MALVPDQKFSTFIDGGNQEIGDIVVGLRSGLNTKFTYNGQLPPGYVVPPNQGGTGFNNGISGISIGGEFTLIGAYSFTGTLTGTTAVTFPTSGTLATTTSASGHVNVGLINQLAYYAAGGDTVSGLATAANSVLVTSAGSVPSLSTTLPASLIIPHPYIDYLTDSSFNEVMSFHGFTTPVNWIQVWNNSTGLSPQFVAKSDTDVNVGLNFFTQAAGTFGFISTATSNQIAILTGASRFSTIFNMAPTTTRIVTFQNASGTLAYLTDIPAGSPSALTKGNDTNVTLTLAGTPATALLQAVSITAGWTGTLALARGGSAANLTASNGGIVYSTASAMAILSGTATANQVLLSGSSTTPAWSTATYPATTIINQLLYSSSANIIGGVTSANSATLYTTTAGIPTMTGSMTNGQILVGSTGANPVLATISAGTGITVTNGAGTITIASLAEGLIVVDQTSSPVTMAVSSVYIINNGASLVTLTLPATAALGAEIQILGQSSGLWKIAQNASQAIKIANTTTSTGVGGSLAAVNQYDNVTLKVIVGGASTIWTVVSQQSTGLTVV